MKKTNIVGVHNIDDPVPSQIVYILYIYICNMPVYMYMYMMYRSVCSGAFRILYRGGGGGTKQHLRS